MEEEMENMEETLKEMDRVSNIPEETLPKKTKKNNLLKTKRCKVISYNKVKKTLDIDFDGYGIRIRNVQDFEGDIVEIKYKSDIGKSNFVYRL